MDEKETEGKRKKWQSASNHFLRGTVGPIRIWSIQPPMLTSDR